MTITSIELLIFLYEIKEYQKYNITLLINISFEHVNQLFLLHKYLKSQNQ